MTRDDLHVILDRIGELRDLFTLGQRALPFLEDVFEFLGEVGPLLDEINASMRESTARMPQATSQLQSVSQATELATTEILDLIDEVLQRRAAERVRLQQMSARIDALAATDRQLVDDLRAAGAPPHVLARVEAHAAAQADAYRCLAGEVDQEIEAVDRLRETINRIMISLQVQDITTQQLAAVNHVIESIRHRMSELLTRLGQTHYEEVTEVVSMPTATQTFDPHARYDHSGDRQALADALFTGLPEGDGAAAPSDPAPDATGPASQAEIDQLFACRPAPPSIRPDEA